MVQDNRLVEIIKERASLLDIVSKVVKLRQSSRTWTGLCPFHNEKTPSFHVYAEQNHFHCYGCNTHGDVITFVQRYHHLGFKEALEYLANELGIDLTLGNKSSHHQYDDIYKALALASSLFHKGLCALGAESAQRKFLEGRGISEQTLLESYQIGWSGTQLPVDLCKHFSNKTLEQAGLLYLSEDRLKPRFYQRLVFPIFSSKGTILGFGGRRLESNKTSKAPKYLNSPETVVFKKSHLLYGADKIPQFRKWPWVLIVEGYIDVIQLKKHQLPSVAPMGTALTEEHLKALLRLKKELIFCYDGDKAGQAASEKTLSLILPHFKGEYEISFVILPEGCDPDSILMTYGKNTFVEHCKARKNFVDFLFSRLLDQYQQRDAHAQMKFNTQARKQIRSVECPDARRALESALFQFVRERFLKFSKKNSPQKTISLPRPPSIKEMLCSLLVVEPSLIDSLRQDDKSLLAMSGDIQLRQLADTDRCVYYHKLLPDIQAKSNTSLLVDSKQRQDEFIYQLKKLNIYLIGAVLVIDLENRSNLTERERLFLESFGDSALNEILGLPSNTKRFKDISGRMIKQLGIDVHTLKEHLQGQLRPLLALTARCRQET